MTKEDEGYYHDNCFGSYIATCNSTVSSKWAKQAKRVANRSITEEKNTMNASNY